MSQTRDVKCCIRCGRNTSARWGVCKACLGPDRTIDEEAEEPDHATELDVMMFEDEYHGETIRDDLF